MKKRKNQFNKFRIFPHENLKGKIKQVETDTYTVDSTGKIGPMDTCCNYIEEFDDNRYASNTLQKMQKEM
jgi:hypothetical protein